MSIFFKRILNIMFVIIVASFVVALASTIIFLFDMEGAKGLLPLIFFCLTLYFLLSYTHKVILDSFSNVHKEISIKNSNLILGIVSMLSFFLSLFVFWL